MKATGFEFAPDTDLARDRENLRYLIETTVQTRFKVKYRRTLLRLLLEQQRRRNGGYNFLKP